MPQQIKPPLTQRAYTLRLHGIDPKNNSWRDALWTTHEAVNKGAKVFGDWLLTLRGGLDHNLADVNISNFDSDIAENELKAKRILLALSWLSVESKLGAPQNFIVAEGNENSVIRKNKVVSALEEILQSRGLSQTEIEGWIKDCLTSLSASIRKDAVWVNRSKAFDEIYLSSKICGRDYAFSVVNEFFGKKYWLILENGDKTSTEFRELARGWLSRNWGSGKKSDKEKISRKLNDILTSNLASCAGKSGQEFFYHLCRALNINAEATKPGDNILSEIKKTVGWKGRECKVQIALRALERKPVLTSNDIEIFKKKIEETSSFKSKGKFPKISFRKPLEEKMPFAFREKRDRISEFAVMLDHAARRVSLAHTWIKRAEMERSRFEEDAKKIDEVPVSVKTWLDDFCLERSGITGALEPYRIRRRAIDGWKELVATWSKTSCITKTDRIAAVRVLQDDPEIEKFGDTQLFESLADDDALCVWHKDGDITKDPDPQPLLDYVASTEAEFQKLHFKVPTYRHPDPLLHPVFCDFGNSRWDINFAIHEAHKNTRRKKIAEDGKKSQVNSVPDKGTAAESPDFHLFSITLWTGNEIVPNALRWQSKRLMHDLALDQGEKNTITTEITRADRLGRAAANLPESGSIRISGLFEQKEWNGRLQAPRKQLNAIADRVAKYGWDTKAQQMLKKLQWLITFSAKLQPLGPWLEYAAKLSDNNTAKLFVSRNGEFAVKYPNNEARKGYAKIILSRLPGLRILSVDLGHRHAAACAVWEALSVEQMESACKAAGYRSPKESDLYLHIKNENRTVIYRRIGADTLPDGTQHPAPWARLDRQFLIKLQGEEDDVRKASPKEIVAVQELEKTIGRESLEHRSLMIDDLMSETIRTLRLALQKHAHYALLAFNLTATQKFLPGGRTENLTREGRIELLAETLAEWKTLNIGKERSDIWAEKQWDEYVTPLLKKAVVDYTHTEGEVNRKTLKKYRAKLVQGFKPLAENILIEDALLRELHSSWASRWREDDIKLQELLRWLRGWILPRGMKTNNQTIRHVGGLSLTRITNLKSLYQIQKAFHMRPEPENPRKNIPEKGNDDLKNFGRKVLEIMERLREQRVKQLSSRIVEAALGIGSENYKHWENGTRRPRQPIVDSRFKQCHAVIVENLTFYRPDEVRTRRENRQLMNWSSGKVKKYLTEACQLYGLHFREVPAGYTSRQDSRTGSPGIRCQDVPIKKFMETPFWQKQVAQAEKKIFDGKGDAREWFLCDLKKRWEGKTEMELKQAGSVRLPLKGGEIFVSACPQSPATKGLQADLNAAANIGLKAFLDPDWPGKWWYLPCNQNDFKPIADKVKGSTAINITSPLKNCETKEMIGVPKRKKIKNASQKSKEIVNLWRNPSAQPISFENSWRESSNYWNSVEAKVINDILRKRSKLEEGKT